METGDPVFPSIRFDTRTEFQAQIFAAIATAQREIWMADAKFADWKMNSPETDAAIRQFLLASRANRLHLIAQDPEVLAQSPRFISLLRMFAQSVECRQISDNLSSRFGQECSFLIVDRARLVRRFHSSTMRGVAEFHPNDVGPWIERFAGMWDESGAMLSGTTLGLG